MKEESPLVSVVLPVFNMSAYVNEAVDSVLGQTYSPIELIAIDDASTDNSRALLEAYGDNVRVFAHETNKGIAGGRNTGIAAAQGSFIAFMDADDIWAPNKIERQMQEFKNDPELDACFTYLECFLSPELSEEIKATRYCPQGPQQGYIGGTMMMRREMVDKTGSFNEARRIGEFIEWYSKAKDLGAKSAIIEDVLYRRRIHGSNTGVNERDSRSDYLKVVRDAIKRRRET